MSTYRSGRQGVSRRVVNTAVVHWLRHTHASHSLDRGRDENQAIAALLYDAAEDHGGKRTLDAMSGGSGRAWQPSSPTAPTHGVEPKPPWRARKEAYLSGLPGKPARSLLVSLADKTYNAPCGVAQFREETPCGRLLEDCYDVLSKDAVIIDDQGVRLFADPRLAQ